MQQYSLKRCEKKKQNKTVSLIKLKNVGLFSLYFGGDIKWFLKNGEGAIRG
jgi:hypothetical protein